MAYALAAATSIIIVLGLAVFGSSAYGQAEKLNGVAGNLEASVDILSCNAGSLGTYADYSTDKKTYSKEKCDYLVQYYNLLCETVNLDADYCSKDSFTYIQMQSYIAREGLNNGGIQVIEKTVKVEVEEDDDDNDNDNDRDHKHRDRYWDRDRDRRGHGCNDDGVIYRMHCDGSKDKDSWTDDERDEKPDNGKEDDENQEQEEEPEQEEEEKEEEPEEAQEEAE